MAILIWSFLCGLVLDTLTFQALGGRSVFFLLALVAAFLYRRKFEIKNPAFILVFGFLGSLLYAWIFGYDTMFPGAFINAVIGLGLFFIISKMQAIGRSSLAY